MNPRTRRISRRSIVCLIAAIFAPSSPVGAFTSILNADSRLVDGRQQRYYGRIITHNNHNWRCRHASPRLPPLRAIAETATKLADYAPAAASLFNNMKLPAAVVTAGMISLGMRTMIMKQYLFIWQGDYLFILTFLYTQDLLRDFQNCRKILLRKSIHKNSAPDVPNSRDFISFWV